MAAEALICIMDAHAVVASCLAIALRHAGFERVATVDPATVDVEAGRDTVGLSPGDIVLVGLLYGDGRTTLPLIQPLADRGCRVMVMTSDQGLPLAGECLHLGAETVLDKAMSFDRLVEVLRRLRSGATAMTEEERTALLDSIARQEEAEQALRRPFRALTDREAEVLLALVKGAAPKQIAALRGISVSTVRGHIHGVLSKLDVSSQREALAMARHAGWP